MPDLKRLKGIKLVIFDLDGTLLNENGEVGHETVRLVKQLSQKGVRFSFASGRLHSALTEYAELLEITTPLISLDGCLIKSYPKGDTIYQSTLSRKTVNKTIALAERYLVRYALCNPSAIYFTEHNSVVPVLIDKFGAAFKEVYSVNDVPDETLEMVFISDRKEYIKEISKQLTFPRAWGLKTSLAKASGNESLYLLEVRKKGSTKATGLAKLCRHLGVSIQDSAVIGDWYNDKELFETKAFKVALSNAIPELKFMADLVTVKDNNQDGVSEFLEHLLKAKSSN